VVAEAITSALTVATIMAKSIIMGTATFIAATTMAIKDLPIGTMIIIADFGTVLGTSTASVRAGGGLTTTRSMCGFAATTINCVIVYPARARRIGLALCHCQSEAAVDLFRERSESGRGFNVGMHRFEHPRSAIRRHSCSAFASKGKSPGRGMH
jgi:hypothetical protein